MQIPCAPARPVRRRSTTLRAALLLAALLGCTGAVRAADAAAPVQTVCTVTINSADERDTLQRHLPKDRYRFVELVQRGQPDWLGAACRRGVTCDALIISGHFDDGTEFYTDRFDDRESLSMLELQQASCSASCSGLFSQLKEVYLFGCNTLKSDPRHVASAEIARSLVRGGRSRPEAERQAALLSERYGQSNRDRLRHVFKDVPLLYGFSSKAPLGRTAGPLLDRYLQTAPAGEVASGRPSPTLLGLFAPSSMIAVGGLTDADPHAGFRRDLCSLATTSLSDGQKLAHMHEVLRRDMSEVRLFLDHLERYIASIGLVQRLRPDVAPALAAIAADRAARDRFLEFARDADEATVQSRMFALARALGWLSPEQEQAEFLRMLSARMARGGLGPTEVDLVCSVHQGRDPAPAQQLLALGAARPETTVHSAMLACLGSAEAHQRTLRVLTSPDDGDVAIAQIYLRHRALTTVDELRTVTSGIARMKAAPAQVRALQTLARQRLADPQSLTEIAALFPKARSIEVQRAIAGILIRADHGLLPRADLERSLRQHRLKSAEGQDVIDVLLRLLRT